MSKPNFWRLKRKAKDKPQASTSNLPNISQKTISSFFRAKDVSSNLGAETRDDPKRPRLEQVSSEVKVPVKLSETAASKLQSFSSSVQKDAGDSQYDSKIAPRGITSSPCQSSVISGIEDDDMDSNLVSSTKSNLENLRSRHQDISKLQDSRGQEIGKLKYTPLEQQVIGLWKEHPGVLLFVECGYKYRFFGKDAEIAAQELNIYAHKDHNFMTASIPVHRLHAHVSRLVEKGYKVGVVKQIETAALKAISDNKSAPFTRKLEHLFTRATLIGEDVGSIDPQISKLDEGISPGNIFCFHETDPEPKSITLIFVAINPSTGECNYEQFSDNSTREELLKRIQLLNPAEILCPSNLSSDTERLLNHCSARLERLPPDWFETTDALTRASSFFASTGDGRVESSALEGLSELSMPVLACLAAVQQHLQDFGLLKAIRPDCLKPLPSGQEFLYLNSSTIRNLQLFSNDSGSTYGSLFWALNHTKTKFGARLLYKWLAQPVRNIKVLEERQQSISELLAADEVVVSQFKSILTNLPDLEKGLTTILHNKCNPVQFFSILDALCVLSSDFSSLSVLMENDFTMPLLLKAVQETVNLMDDVQRYRDNINLTAAKDGDKTKLLKDFSAFPTVEKFLSDIENTTKSLNDLRPEIAQKLSLFSVQYTSVSGQEYLIEVKNTNSKSVPVNWRKISSTKQVSRYRPPAVDRLFGELQRLREMLRVECQKAYIELLQEFSQQYFKLKQAVSKVATIDVILSLAHVAQQEGYCRPKLIESEDPQLIIKRGRHPVVPLLFPGAEQFVPNDTHLVSSGECCMVLSGPNMGGKSCYIRQVALIALLAHIGSYVPAENAEISLLEAIFTRMGARDEMFHGRSTLMVELEETSAILQKASKHSLVLLDELGRGTGSCDGSAIACATLQHLALEVQCLSLFVTHYPSVMDTVNDLGNRAGNYHMAFVLHDQDESEFLTFLYEVVKGAADRSYGINVARLANLDKALLLLAATVANDLETQARHRRKMRQSFVDAWFGKK